MIPELLKLWTGIPPVSEIAAFTDLQVRAIMIATPAGASGHQVLYSTVENGVRAIWIQRPHINWYEAMLSIGAAAFIFVLSVTKQQVKRS